MKDHKRNQYSPSFKASLALEAVRGRKTVNELAQEYGVHPSQISHWKRRLLTGSTELFARSSPVRCDKAGYELLNQQISQLRLDLKKLAANNGSKKFGS